MIILRYLSREILTTTVVISCAWLVFTLGRRFAQYLDEAWRGELASSAIFTIIGYRIPEFLSLILPVGFFLGIFVALGRLYVDNEMAVLSGCGVSKRRILAYVMVPASLIAIIVGTISLFLGPYSLRQVEAIRLQQASRSELDILSPNRFQALSGNSATVYFKSFNDDKTQMQKVFIAEMTSSDVDDGQPLSVLVADTAEEWFDPDSGRRYLLLKDGYQYIGTPGKANYRQLKFDRYGYYLPQREVKKSNRIRVENVTVRELLEISHPAFKAELHWRLALPIMVLVATLIAVPLSHTNPRQGRFSKLVPAFFIFMIYPALLIAGRGWLEEKKIPVSFGLWWVHAIFMTVACGLLWHNNGQPRSKLRSPLKSAVNKEKGDAQ
ncbi:LPS export ABC transporter permease LptF [Aurantivibrio plasticivorans]